MTDGYHMPRDGKDRAMSVQEGARRRRPRSWIYRLAADRKGVAAIEFALVVPLLLCMYFVTMEASQGIETNKKISRMASMVADLVTQQQQTTPAELDAIMNIGESILMPYSRSDPKIMVTAIEVTDEAKPKVKVKWFRKVGGNETNGWCPDSKKGDDTTVPASLNTRGAFLIRVDSCLKYKTMIAWSGEEEQEQYGLAATFADIPMKETYYLRPRMSQEVKCDTC